MTGSWRYKLGLVALVLAVLAAGYFLWLRDSSLVKVDNVDVVGVTAGDRDRIVTELTRIAEQQTTLNADPAKIQHAAAAFPTIASVTVDPNFPHGMRIEVEERPPALIVDSGGEEVAAAADGTLLTGLEVSGDEADRLPVLELEQVPDGKTLQGQDLQQGLILGAAPAPLAPLIDSIEFDKDHGVEVTMEGDIGLHFGTGARAAEKWAAAAAVLADPKTDVLCYVDVRVPERAAAGCAA